jgi:hypothetical protein
LVLESKSRHDLWGTLAVIVGLLLAAVGITPMALLATMFKGDWTWFVSVYILGCS